MPLIVLSLREDKQGGSVWNGTGREFRRAQGLQEPQHNIHKLHTARLVCVEKMDKVQASSLDVNPEGYKQSSMTTALQGGGEREKCRVCLLMGKKAGVSGS